jgi:hypothetical protein
MSQSLNLTNAEALRAIAPVAGFNRSPSTWDSTQLTDARDIIRSGLRRFFNPPKVNGVYHAWLFLERSFYQAGSATYSTGTVTVSGGTVTLAGGTWPAYAADCVVRVAGRTFYVVTRDSDTALTIDNDQYAAAAGTSYTLHRWRYPLPTDFAEFVGGVVYDRGDRQGYMLRNSVDQEIRLRYATQFQTNRTCMYAIVPGGANDTSDWYLTFWPTADDDASFQAVYRAAPQDNLDNSDLTADGTVVQVDAVHAETLIAAIRAAAEEFYGDGPGVYAQQYATRLAASVDIDRHSQGSIDFDRDPRVDPRRLSLLYHNPTYSN